MRDAEIDHRLRLALAAARAGTWEYDVASGANSWSEELWPLYGLERSRSASYENWTASVHEDDLPRVAEAVSRSVVDGTPYTAEWRVRGSVPTRWLLGQGHPERDGRGAVVRLLGVVVDITDRKLAEDVHIAAQSAHAARASEARLRAVLDAVPAAVFIASDSAARVIVPNRFAAELMGVSEATNVSQSAPPEALVPFRVLRGGAELPPDDMPVQLAARTGTAVLDSAFSFDFGSRGQRHFFGHAVPLRDEQGAPSGAVGAFTDVTALRDVEAELRRREAALRTYFESPAEGLLVCEGGRAIVDVNRTFCEFLGYSRHELIGRDWREFTPAEDVGQDSAAIDRVKSGAQLSHSREKRYLRKDGSVVWGSVVATAVTLPDGGGQQVVVFVRDITQAREAAAALEASELRFRTLAEVAPLGVLELSVEGELLFVNPVWLAHAGLTREEAATAGRRVDRVHPDDRELLAAFRARLAAGGRDQVVEFRYRHASGRELWVHSLGVLIPEARGKPARLLMMTVDVTRQRELARKVAQSARLAAMGSIAAGLAHHFNNPVAAVMSGQQHALDFVRSLKSRLELGVPTNPDALVREAEEAAEALLDAQEGGSRVAQLVKEMGRLDEVDRRRAVVPLAEVARASLRWVAPQLMRGASVTIEDVDAPSARISAQQLEYVIASLVTNALRAVRPGESPWVTLRLRTLAGQPVIEVVDRGVGIAASDLPRVFDFFYTTRPVGERRGAGLGLSVCHALIEAHGGTIELTSQPGVGTTVLVQLPAP